MTFEQWLESLDGRLAMSYTAPSEQLMRATALRLAFVAGEMEGGKAAHERFERILQASPPTTSEPLNADGLVVQTCAQH